MSLNFPRDPTVGQNYVYEGQTFVWNGAVWLLQGIPMPWASLAEAVEGNASDKVLSPKVAGDLVKGLPRTNTPFDGIPTDMTAQRALETDYLNDLPRSRFILVEGLSMGNVSMMVGQSAPATIRVAASSITSTGQHLMIGGFVPAGWYYRLTVASGTISKWTEWL